MTDLERRIKAKIPGPDTGLEIRRTMCDICSPGMHCGINAYVKDGKVIKIEGMEPIVDICYMPMPDSKGELYAEFVPAWRFRFRGEDGNTHRVNAYTGEVIR